MQATFNNLHAHPPDESLSLSAAGRCLKRIIVPSMHCASRYRLSLQFDAHETFRARNSWNILCAWLASGVSWLFG